MTIYLYSAGLDGNATATQAESLAEEPTDPTMGSSGFLIQLHQYMKKQGQGANDISLYGQDSSGNV